MVFRCVSKTKYHSVPLVIQSFAGKVGSEKSVSWSFSCGSYCIPSTTCVKLGSNYLDLDNILPQKQFRYRISK
jgi:hypothetical protein